MLIVDQCEKAAVASKRKAEAKHIVVSVPRKVTHILHQSSIDR